MMDATLSGLAVPPSWGNPTFGFPRRAGIPFLFPFPEGLQSAPSTTLARMRPHQTAIDDVSYASTKTSRELHGTSM
jgi:hypothetical protein